MAEASAFGGRFVLGLGSGVRRVNADWHNATGGKPINHLRKVVAVIRRFVAKSDPGAGQAHAVTQVSALLGGSDQAGAFDGRQS